MKAVWSFWTKPFEVHQFAWYSRKHHLLSWVLSVETAKQHYPDTWLITDDAGARLLVEGVGLQFNRVSTELNALEQLDPGWWGMGKIYAYKIQTEPFVHIDNDLFLWKQLPQRLEQADMFVQNPEQISPNTPYYQPAQVEHALNQARDGWLPEEWLWYRRTIQNQRAEVCGLFGGNHIAFINCYAEASFRLVTDPRNQSALRALPNKRMHSLVVDQYLLSAFVDYHQARADSPYRGVQIAYLFDSVSEFYNPERLIQAGFTHLIGGAKRNPVLAKRLENRVRCDYPEFYERCSNLAEGNE